MAKHRFYHHWCLAHLMQIWRADFWAVVTIVGSQHRAAQGLCGAFTVYGTAGHWMGPIAAALGVHVRSAWLNDEADSNLYALYSAL